MREKVKQINIKMAREYGLIEEEEVSFKNAQDAIRNPENFAKHIESSKIEISPGVHLASHTLDLGEGNFTNIYDLYFSNKDPKLNTKIITRKKSLYPHRLFKNEQAHPSKDELVACINGAFFFLQDDLLKDTPSEIIYNLNINDNKILGLPTVDRATLFVTKDGHIHATELEARGSMTIGKKEINWVGSKSINNKFDTVVEVEKGQTILFNSACCTIEYEDPKDKTTLRRLRQDLNLTPKRNNLVDIVISSNKEGKLNVESIIQGGGTDFFKGNFILQMNINNSRGIQVGDEVNPTTLGSLKLSEIKSAMTTGPMVHHFLNHDDHEINHDPSLGSFPPFDPKTRYARSVMYEDKSNNIHMVVFDAVPRSKHMKGVTPNEVAQNIPKDARWAVFLDGGQSSRITFESNDKIDARGNQQYVRLHKIDKTSQTAEGEGRFLWTNRGRPLSSMIALYKLE